MSVRINLTLASMRKEIPMSQVMDWSLLREIKRATAK